MIVDEGVCRLLAAREGLPMDFVAKEFYLMQLLKGLSDLGALDSMIFKGGTALNKIYIKEGYRFSEDLDFDFTGKSWPELFKVVTTKISGFEALEARRIIGDRVAQVDFLYKTEWGKKDRVRLDVNTRPYTKTVDPIQMREAMPQFTGSGVSSVQVYGIDDLLSRKMSALKDRAEGKDIFDVSNALGLADKKKLLKAIALIATGKGGAKEFLSETVKKVEGADYKRLRKLTNPYIPLKNRPPDWKILADTLIMKLQMLMEEAGNTRRVRSAERP
ncbi:MAG: nucleotidyl transferase AbiEii/AbiGii toxin family protein [Candidatus Micrarchaeaceae archaeon]